jgi:sugar phosphate isomerase/epimerase
MDFPQYKKRYPFRLAAPSFIFPADYVTNARKLAPCLDEVELIFFESRPDSLPSKREIEQLRNLQERQTLQYNVHLPLDLNLCAKDADEREDASAAITGVLELVRPLAATTYTLHLPAEAMDPADRPYQARPWQERALLGLQSLFRRTDLPPRMISVETLDYPPSWIAPLVERLDLSVCVDVGHVLLHGFDLWPVFNQFRPRITICHLHGVSEGKDHLALQHMDENHLRTVKTFLSGFTQTLSLEVFSPQNLRESLQTLALLMQKKGLQDASPRK